ncbi:MAG: CPBP family intramembrane metalloprotease [Kiritimatiellae bacterium]|nr:CPBP family intramembrane metalloprotease [Kiritimatiellia bacterium]
MTSTFMLGKKIMETGCPQRTENVLYSTPELLAVIVCGAGHVLIEVFSDGISSGTGSITRPQHYYNITAFVLWGIYLLWQLARVHGIAQEWGFRKEGFVRTIKACLIFALFAMIPLLIYSWRYSRFPLPVTFWLVMALYPVWGLGQQFALQALITRNLRTFVPGLWSRILTASVIFSVAHFPNYWLMVLTLIAGVAFSWIYEKYRNLWAIGIVHGFLGALAYYLVLGDDPGAEILGLFR